MKSQKIISYAVLVIILSSGMYTFLYVSQSSYMQLVVGVLTSVAYVMWGIIHHLQQKDLHRKVVIEYILIGLIAIVLLATVLLR